MQVKAHMTARQTRLLKRKIMDKVAKGILAGLFISFGIVGHIKVEQPISASSEGLQLPSQTHIEYSVAGQSAEVASPLLISPAPTHFVGSTKDTLRNGEWVGVWQAKGKGTEAAYILEVFGQEDGEKMLQMIATCENKPIDPKAVSPKNKNGTRDYGLAMINTVHLSGKEFSVCKEAHNDWQSNIKCAKAIKDKYSFSAWSCSHVLNVKSFWE